MTPMWQKIMNSYFSSAVQGLEIDGYAKTPCSSHVDSDPISKIIVNLKTIQVS